MGISQVFISSATQTIDDAANFILMLKGRVTAARQLTATRDLTIIEKDETISARDETISATTATIAARDATIFERNGQVDALVTLTDELRTQVTGLGGSLAETEARYQEQVTLAAAAAIERAAAEEARIAAEVHHQELHREKAEALAAAEQRLAEKEALLAEEEEEERLDAIEMEKLAAAIERLKAAATEG